MSACLAATILTLVTAPAAQDVEPWPFVTLATDVDLGEVVLSPELDRIDGLLAIDRVRFAHVGLPDGSHVDVELARLDLARQSRSVHLDGLPAPDVTAELAASAWRGTVVGAEDSDVALAFSRYGCQGWIRRGDDLFHVVSRAGPGGDWTRFAVLVVTDARLGLRVPGCAADELTADAPARKRSSAEAPPLPSGALDPTYEARIAIEGDYQYFQLFGDANAAIVYVTTLFTWVSAQFEQQVGTVLTVSYLNVNTTPNDGWTTPDNGGNCIDMIYEFQAAWAGNIPSGADLGYFLSGATLGCGAGFIGGLCHSSNNFAVAGNQNGQNPFPVVPSASGIDYYAACHEIGHNFDAIHTHDYCPPIDQCAPAGWYGQCQTQQVCIYPGTLMSYCNACGGFANIDTVFHAQSAADMRAWVEAAGCLPALCPDPSVYCTAQVSSEGCTPSIGTTGMPTLTGPDDFHVKADDVLANQNGLLFYGFDAASIPLLGGTLCVQPPVVRTVVLSSGGLAPPPPCDGTLDFHWTQAFMGTQNLTVGSTVFAQFWYRDPAAASGSGLTDAVTFAMCR